MKRPSLPLSNQKMTCWQLLAPQERKLFMGDQSGIPFNPLTNHSPVPKFLSYPAYGWCSMSFHLPMIVT